MAQQDEYSETLAKIIQQYQELGRLLPEQQIQQATLASGFPKVVQGMLGVAQATGAVTKGMLESAKAIHDGTKGMKAFDGALDGASKGLMILAGALAALAGPIGIITGAIVAGIGAYTKLAKMANEQSDKLYEAFQQMSRSGGAAADGLTGLYRDVQRLGGGIQDLGDFVSLVTSSAGEFALFAGSVFEGRKEFAKLSKEMEPFRASLMNAGMTQKEINEATAGYIKLQSRIGMTQNRNTAELSESTRKYLLEQDALTKLLGMTRKEQEDAREAVRNREIFAAKTLALRNAGQEAAAAQLEKTFLLLSKDSKEVGDGFADIVSGNLRTEAAQKLMRATQGEAMQIQQELSDGTITAAQAADRMAMSLKRSLDMFGETQGVLGNFNTTFTDIAGAIRVASRLLTGGYERQEQIIERNAKRQGIFGDAMDEELKRQTSLRLQQVNSMQNMQDFIRYGIKPATKSTEFFGKVIEYVSRLLPGAGAIKRQYDAEKKASEDLTDRETKLSEAMARVIEAQATADEAQTPEAVAAAQRALDTAKADARAAKAERDQAQERYERAKAGLAVDEPIQRPAPTTPEEAAHHSAAQRASAAAEALAAAEARGDLSDEERRRLEQEERTAALAARTAAQEAANARRRARLAANAAARDGTPAATPPAATPPAATPPAATPPAATPPAGPAATPPAATPPAGPAATPPAATPPAGPAATPPAATPPAGPAATPPAVPPASSSQAAPMLPGRAARTRAQQSTPAAPPALSSQVAPTGQDGGISGVMPADRSQPSPPRARNVARARPTGNRSMSDDDVKAMIIAHEGIRTRPYQDTKGLWTVGVGHLIGDGKTLPAEWDREFSRDEVMAIFEQDYKKHKEAAARQTPNFSTMTDVGQAAMTDLTFNMGPNWLSNSNWPNTYKALQEKNNNKLVQGLSNSLWYQQVGGRAPTVVELASNAFPMAKDGGIFDRPVIAGEAGPEAIIPLKNGAVPVMLSGNQEVVDAMKSIVSEFKSAMQGMIDRMPRADDVDVTAESLRVLQQIESANRGASDALSQLVRLAQN